jgi:hypothetical protein
MSTSGVADQASERAGWVLVPAMVWLPGDTYKETQFITAAGMKYAGRVRAVGRSGQRRPYGSTLRAVGHPSAGTSQAHA